MRFQVLGPLRVNGNGRDAEITASRDRALLAMLLLHAGRPVPVGRLIETIWTDKTPRHARNQVQGCVSRLRKRLEQAGFADELIVTEPGGYRAAVDQDDLDLLVFRRRVAEARAAAGDGHHDAASTSYRAALALWRGPAFAGLASPLLEQAAAAIEEERAQALEERLGVELAYGGGGELIAELTDLVGQYPHRERLHGALMTALYRAGRQADALTAYRNARRLFRRELGIEPGADLQRLHHAILNGGPIPGAPAPSQAPSPPPPTPRELPPDVAGFTGRADALKALDELLPEPNATSVPAIITAITGTAGVGKTALAVHWAHRVAERFPGGQLYLNLRGYATATPLRPIEALAMLLRSLGIPPDQIPVNEAEASARFRTVLASRQRVLVVLDNARSVDQVRPLLPGNPGCLALVTSRDRLSGLVAREGARRITLDVLSTDEAYDLLSRLFGEGRAYAEQHAVTDLAKACAHLPLALRIAAAVLNNHPHRSIEGFVTDLVSGHPVEALTVAGDDETAVRAAFDLSYRTLSAAAQRLFRLLGLVPGPDVTADAAAALADLPRDDTQRLMDELADAHLVDEFVSSRYTLHDLMRHYARHLAAAEQRRDDQPSALKRLLDWYVRSADAASTVLLPTIARLKVPAPAGRQPSISVADRAQAMAWLVAERANLVAGARYAAEHGPRSAAWLLADAIRAYIWNGMHDLDALAIGTAGLAAATAAGSGPGEATARLTLATVLLFRDEHEASVECCAGVPALARRAGWDEGQAAAHNIRSVSYFAMGRPHSAIRELDRARSINQRLGKTVAVAANLNNLGRIYRELGDLRGALRLFDRGLELFRAAGHGNLTANAFYQLGATHRMLGEFDRALDYLARSLALHREAGNRHEEAHVLRIQAATLCDTGRYSEALAPAAQALAGLRAGTNPRDEAYGWRTMAEVQHRMGNLTDAAACFERALRLDKQAEPRIGALIGLGSVYQDLGQHEQASACAHQALDEAREVGYQMLVGQAMTVLADIQLGMGRLAAARQCAEDAVASHRLTGYRIGEATALTILGRLDRAELHEAAALARWQAARELFEQIGAPAPPDLPASSPQT